MGRTIALGILLVGVGVGLTGVRPASAQDREARGTATFVSDSSFTVKVGERDLTFVVDANTTVEAVGAGRRTRQTGQAGATGPKFTDMVKSGGAVLVTYREANGKNQAIRVRPVTSAGAGAGSTSEASKISSGKVKSVTASALTLTSDGKDLRFVVDARTKVSARGAGTATKAAGGRIAITEIVGTGDTVSVTYNDASGTFNASDVRVVVKAR